MKPRRNLFLGSLLVVALSQVSLAGILYWDGSDLVTSGAQGGTGTWNTNTTANWWNGSADVVWPALGGTDDDAVFGGTAGTVTITTATANDITFNTTGYTLSGGTLTLNGTTPTITNATGIDATISSIIAGSAGLKKDGAGILTLSGVNTYTGTTTISAGILKAGNAAALGSAASAITDGTTVSSGATLDIGGQNLGAEVVTVSGTGVGGNGAIINTGGQQINAFRFVTLAGDTTFGGPNRWDIRKATSATFDMGGHTLTKTGTNYLGIVDASITNVGNVIVNQGELNLTYASTFGTGTPGNSVTVNNGGILGLYQTSNTHGSTLNLNTGSTLRGESGSGTHNTWGGAVNLSGEVTMRADGVLSINGNIGGTGNITKVGGSTLTLRGSNNFSGTTTVNAGTLTLDYVTNDNSKLDNSSALILNGVTVSLANGTHSEVVGSTTLNAGTANTISRASGTAVLNLNTITAGSGAALNFGAASIATTDNTNTNGILGAWATVGGTDWAVNSTDGADGAITAYSAYTLSSLAGISAGNYANKHISVDANQTLDGGITPYSLQFNTAGARTLTLQGTNTIGNGAILVGTTVAANASTITGGDLTGASNGDLVINQQNTSNSLTIASTIVNNGTTNLVKVGAGTAILTGTNSYTGTTTVGAGGTLQIGNGTTDGSISTSSGIINRGTLAYNLVGNQSFGNEISGTGSITKSGAGALTLSGDNTYTGATTISGGRLIVKHVNALGATTGNTRINTGGTLELATNDSVAAETLDMGSGNTGTIVVNRADNGAGITHTMGTASFGNGTLNVEAGANVISGTARLSLAGLSLSAGNAGTMLFNPTTAAISITGGVSSTSNYAKVLGLGGTNTNNLISGIISNGTNTVAVTKTGSGTWELSNANTYTGATIVSDGKLILSGNRVATSNGIDVGNVAGQTGTLDIRGDLPMGGNVLSVGLTASGASGIVNHSAGKVSFTSGNAVLIGRNTAGVSGTYNLSGGELKTAASTERGIMLGTNAGASGNLINSTFNLSGTGFLNNATGTLQVVRGDDTSSWQNSTYNQTGGTSTNGYLIIGGGIDGANALNSLAGNDSIANFSVTGGTFTATNFNGLSRGNNVVSTMTIGGTADVTLPAFPTTRGTGSTATLYFDGGVLRPTASSTAYLGGTGLTAYINGGGAKFNTGGFDITVSQALLAGTGTGGLTKEGAGILTLSGTNTFTGNVTLNGAGNGGIKITNSDSLGTHTTGKTVNLYVGTNGVAQLDMDPGASGLITLSNKINFTVSSNSTTGSGIVSRTGTNKIEGKITMQSGLSSTAISSSSGSTLTLSGVISANASGRTLHLGGDSTNANTISGDMDASGGFGNFNVAKNNAGTWILTGTKSYSGTTSVNGGKLVIDSTGSLDAASAVSVTNTGSELVVDGTVNGSLQANVSTIISGSGTIKGAATIEGMHNPGNSPGIQTFTSGLTYGSTAVLNAEFVGDTLGVRGADFDGVNVTGGDLSISSLATLKLLTSSIDYTAGLWDTGRNFTVIDYTGAGNSAGIFQLDTTGAGEFAGQGSWSLANTSGDVVLSWAPIPEPRAALLGGLGMLALLRRRRVGK